LRSAKAQRYSQKRAIDVAGDDAVSCARWRLAFSARGRPASADL
jgi:hypothetical protein